MELKQIKHKQWLCGIRLFRCLFGDLWLFSGKNRMKRKCEVTYQYNAQNEDELELLVGETIDVIKEVRRSILSHHDS